MEILTTLGVVALGILIYFIIQTLLVIQASLRKLDIVLLEAEIKLRKLDSFINTVENVSDITEKETMRLKEEYIREKLTKEEGSSIDPSEVSTWLISSVKLGLKILRRR